MTSLICFTTPRKSRKVATAYTGGTSFWFQAAVALARSSASNFIPSTARWRSDKKVSREIKVTAYRAVTLQLPLVHTLPIKHSRQKVNRHLLSADVMTHGVLCLASPPPLFPANTTSPSPVTAIVKAMADEPEMQTIFSINITGACDW